MHIFEQKQFNSFLDDEKCQNFAINNLTTKNCDNFGIFGQKNLKSWSQKLEIFHKEN